MKGKLYVVATPIGNLEDMTYRAVRILQEVDWILCENEQNSKPLLIHYQISTRIITLHRLRQESDYNWIFNFLDSGKSIAYISDAGTPGISDPGAGLVRNLRSKGYEIVPVPGASALSTILSVSGFQTNPTIFLGFLSPKKSQKERELAKWAGEEVLIVLFESVHKIETTLNLIQKLFPSAEVLIGRELTKIHEEILLWRPVEKIPKITNRGEFVILINNHLKKIAKEDKTFTDS